MPFQSIIIHFFNWPNLLLTISAISRNFSPVHNWCHKHQFKVKQHLSPSTYFLASYFQFLCFHVSNLAGNSGCQMFFSAVCQIFLTAIFTWNNWSDHKRNRNNTLEGWWYKTWDTPVTSRMFSHRLYHSQTFKCNYMHLKQEVFIEEKVRKWYRALCLHATLMPCHILICISSKKKLKEYSIYLYDKRVCVYYTWHTKPNKMCFTQS